MKKARPFTGVLTQALPEYLNFELLDHSSYHPDIIPSDEVAKRMRYHDRLCGLVVRVLGYRSGGPVSIPGTTRFSEKKKKKRKTSSGSGTGSTHLSEYN
jgi:hypothetical protein